ncbi:DUF2877 domain-containing protein [Anaerospora hongkongensis]|uniref:DUF2877 domain-containing protein n=1 Tax=Anaerospora hongkongensis TaxID=244830 RepID=UPI0028A2C480|nr:DUF2877 domain-containing protein [Anaerospora hongkongensis]
MAAALPFSQLGIRTGDRVWVSNSALCVSRIAIDITAIVPWQSVIPGFPMQNEWPLFQQSLSFMKNYIGCSGKSGGLRDLWTSGTPCDGGQSLYAVSLRERAKRMLTALREQNVDDAYQAGRSLLGLGNGLTPSGDDFCAALVTVFHMSGSPFGEQHRQLGQQLASAARQQTTFISQEMLELAASGQTRQNISAFLREFTSSSTNSLMRAADKVMAAGCSSGTDWAAGLTAGLEIGKALAQIGREGEMQWM